MDGVIVDFGKQIEAKLKDTTLNTKLIESPDLIKDIFLDPPPIDGAIDAINQLQNSNTYNLFIATTAPWGNPDSFTHKRLWIEKHFGGLFEKKMFITHRKDLLVGEFLIDDRLANGAGQFRGELLRFGWDYENELWNEYKDWSAILNFLL